MKHKPFDGEKYRKKYKTFNLFKSVKTIVLEPKLKIHKYIKVDEFIQNLNDIKVDIEIYVDAFMEKRQIIDRSLVRIEVKDIVDYKQFSRFEDVMLGYRDGNEITNIELTMYQLYKDENEYIAYEYNKYLKNIEYSENHKKIKKLEEINKR